MSTLEQRITAAMTAPIASADLTVLIGDVENSLAAAIANAQEHAKSALDITAGDGSVAFEESQKHDLISKRLRVSSAEIAGPAHRDVQRRALRRVDRRG